jgi:signal peptide peptidase SppA
MSLFTSQLWAIEPRAMTALQMVIQTALFNRQFVPGTINTAGITAGPAQDGERTGLPLRVHGKVAVVSTIGPMLKNPPYWASDYVASTSATRRAILSAGADADIETIVWRTDTPGGSVDGIAELADAVEQVAKIKPIIVQVDGMTASAGLYATAHANEIRAGRMDMIGSIGTRMMLYDWSKAFEEAGIRAIPIDTGEFKSAGALGTEITDAQIGDFQRIVNDYQADFKTTLMAGRGLNDKQFTAVNDGRVWLTSDALKLGLVDKVATLDQTLAELTGAGSNRVGGNRVGGRSTSSAHARLRMQNRH